MDFEALHSASFTSLDTTVSDWTKMLTKLTDLKADAKDGLHGKASKANWAGYNATVSREFIGKTAEEFNDAYTQAESIRNIMRDTQGELKTQQRLLKEAIERGRGNHMSVKSAGSGFTVTPSPDPKPANGQKDVDALRDELQGILDKATEMDNTAATSLKALVDLTDYGFSGQKYADRDSAVTAIREAENLARIAKKNPEDLTVKEFDALNAGLKKYSGDELFSERFAEQLGPKGTLEFWAGIADPYTNRDVYVERREQLGDLQKNLSLTLATATQADTLEMHRWKGEMTDLGSQPISKNSTTQGFQVMSNLMRWGNFDDQFLKSYGSELMETEKAATSNGRHGATVWTRMGMDPNLNHTGEDSGSDPMIGYLKALSNSPDAATDFFNDSFLSKDEDHDFKEEDEKTGKEVKASLSNFDYLFEERDWPPERDKDGDDSISGRNNLAMALEAATTGHPAGELPTLDTPAHNAGQAELARNVMVSISENPGRLTEHSYMSDSVGQIAAEYMPDINRGMYAGKESGNDLFPVVGEPAKIPEVDITRFLYAVGQNPEGYAAVNAGQAAYTTSLMEYHFANPEAFVKDPNFSDNDNLKQAIEGVAKVSGEVQGTIGAGRAFASEEEGGVKDQDFNDAIQTTSTWVGTGVGIGVGLATAPFIGPGGIVAGGLAGTAVDEILGGLTEGALKDSSGEVIYRNGQEIDATRQSTYTLVETAAEKAGESAKNPSPAIVDAAANAAEHGFNNARTNLSDFIDGEGTPRQLEPKK
ncbi:hypothetical protein SSPS47_25810 [Streptomyces sp. S4.7]|uniref:DUF6571 family protein n=1 Tax=Streptomyces sp. S4.7 TaxID=2705439 RepID=UPI0013971BE5|nr:DUF6571 family protein [Streptomyces sp. S4.7]QHY98531.1 hypothetical protein SSPS47_25810 [Streptomyces sp. S4.7]